MYILVYIHIFLYTGSMRKKKHDKSLAVSRWGNSLAIRLPHEILESLSVEEGSLLNLFTKKDKIILEPQEEDLPTLSELLKSFAPEKQHSFSWGVDRGREIEDWVWEE